MASGATPAMRHLRYNAFTNTFSEAQTSPVVSGIGHGYDHAAVNPTTGDLYHRLYNSTGTARKVLGASTFNESTIPAWYDEGSSGYVQVAIGTCWWSGTFTGGTGGGAQGSWMIFNSGFTGGSGSGNATDGEATAYNPLTNTWFWRSESMLPFSYNAGGGTVGATYHSVMEYSPQNNCAVYGGGGAAPFLIRRLNSDGTSSAMPAPPNTSGIGVYRGILCNDPATGNFLLLSDNNLWELNPTGAGHWTLQTGSRVPPSGFNPSATTGPPNGVIACPIPELGVVAYIQQTSAGGGSFYLYKHA